MVQIARTMCLLPCMGLGCGEHLLCWCQKQDLLKISETEMNLSGRALGSTSTHQKEVDQNKRPQVACSKVWRKTKQSLLGRLGKGCEQGGSCKENSPDRLVAKISSKEETPSSLNKEQPWADNSSPFMQYCYPSALHRPTP